jgi:nicotinamidase-related amidase
LTIFIAIHLPRFLEVFLQDKVLTKVRREFWTDSKLAPVKLVATRMALLIIDMQYLSCDPDYGRGAIAKKNESYPKLQWYFSEIPRIVKNQKKLIEMCASKNIEVVYTKVCSLTCDGRDTGYFYRKTIPFGAITNTRETEILDELKPQKDQIVIEKTTDSAFNSNYNLDRILRNIGIQTLLICGVLTNACVESTARNAADLGYDVVTIGDACLTLTKLQHEVALMELGGFYAEVKSTREVLNELKNIRSAFDKDRDQKPRKWVVCRSLS